MKPLLVTMCGIAFSGKSTLAKSIAERLDAVLISFDAINESRGLNGGDGSMTKKQWLETHDIALQKAELLLRQNQSVVLDDTFSHRFLRNQATGIAAKTNSCFQIIALRTPINEVQKRRVENDKTLNRSPISDEVFDAHVQEFQEPDPDENAMLVESNCNVERLVDRLKP